MATACPLLTSDPSMEKVGPSKSTAAEVHAALEAYDVKIEKIMAQEAPVDRRLTKAEPEDEPQIYSADDGEEEDEEDDDEPRLEFPDPRKVWEFPLTNSEKKMRLTQLQDQSRCDSEVRAVYLEGKYKAERQAREFAEELNKKLRHDLDNKEQFAEENKRIMRSLVHVVDQLSEMQFGGDVPDHVRGVISALRLSELPGEGKLLAASTIDTGAAFKAPLKDAAESPEAPLTMEKQVRELIVALDNADQRDQQAPCDEHQRQRPAAHMALEEDKTVWHRGKSVICELLTGWGGGHNICLETGRPI